MRFKVRLFPSALADLDEATSYLVTHNPRAAYAWLRNFEDTFKLLQHQPRSGLPRDDIRPGMRRLVKENYHIFYEIVGDEIVIVRIVHGRRNPDDPLV